MPKSTRQPPVFGLMAAIALFLILEACIARVANRDCGSSICGDVEIKNPFRLTTQPSKCGDHRFELECDSNNRTSLVMKYDRFNVQNITYETQTAQIITYSNIGSQFQNITYESYTMQAIDANLSKDDNCSLPRSSFRVDDFCKVPYSLSAPSQMMFLVNCKRPMKSSSYINASHCPTSSSHPPASYFYFLDGETPARKFDESCTIDALVPIMVKNISGMSTSDIYQNLLLVFEIDSFGLQYCYEKERPFQLKLESLQYALQTYAYSFVHFLFNGPHVFQNTYYVLVFYMLE
ncbi:PR5-like receptor kinase [Hibiscus syriacus]|uniref:PR5-like receptor kinase n=1 Tax=Hibiscus syriacus TaxID=106335 RepID=A0A6A3AGZ4_HIBSY|nr:PR5-like receptor kinase [Hibiscus syriacus]